MTAKITCNFSIRTLRTFKSSACPRASIEPLYKSYRVIGGGNSSNCHVVSDDGWNISTDTPQSQGGTNTAPQPVLLLLAALCGCELATARFVALKSLPKIKMGRIEFDIHAKRDERGVITLPLTAPLPAPARLIHVWGTATIHDTNATHDQISSLGAEVHLRCPVANMILLSGCSLEIDWRIANLSAENNG